MSRLKILVDAHIFSGIGQGSVTYIKGLYESFCKNYSSHYDIYFAVNDKSDVPYQIMQYIPNENIIELKSKNSLERILVEFTKIIKKYQIDFAHFQYIIPISLRGRCKYIVTTHDILFNYFPEDFPLLYRIVRNFFFKRSLQKATIKLTVSKYSKQTISEFYHIPESEIAITPNAVDEIFFQPFDKADSLSFVREKYKINSSFILYVSRIEPRKNHSLVLQAYKEMHLFERGISLVFVGGKGIPCTELQSMIDSLNEQEKEKFYWVEDIPFADLIGFYRAAELFIYPSKAEGFGIPPLEAAAVGSKVLLSNTTAMSEFEFMVDSFFNPELIEELKDKIKISLSTPINEKEISNRIQTIKSKYSWEKSADILHSEIQKKISL